MSIEQTLSIIKPDATKRSITGKINAKIEEAGLKIVAQKRIRLSKDQAEAFYGVHSDKPFFLDLVNFITSGPVVVQVLESENAITKYREIMGATNPNEAKLELSGQNLQNLLKLILFMDLIVLKMQKLRLNSFLIQKKL